MMNPLENLGVYGGGVDERVECHGRIGGSSVCPRGSVHRMNELRVLLMSPRGSVLLLGGATSSSMLRGDSEIECLLEELDAGSLDDDECVFSVKTLVAIFHIVVAQLTTSTPGVACRWEKHTREVYGGWSLLL
jgi:hypothetical protein